MGPDITTAERDTWYFIWCWITNEKRLRYDTAVYQKKNKKIVFGFLTQESIDVYTVLIFNRLKSSFNIRMKKQGEARGWRAKHVRHDLSKYR